MEQTTENKIEFSGEQIKAIEFSHEQPDGKERSAVVAAAAGSGKTTLLVERIIRLLSDKKRGIPADSLAIMTFTKNATASMRDKLNNALAEKLDKLSGAKSPEETETYDYLKEQMFRLRQASISTIDAFCLRMIKENAETFELPLNFRIADSAKKASLQAQAMKAAMQEFYGAEFSDDERDKLFYSFNFEDDKALEKAVLSVAEKLSTHPDPEEWMNGTLDAYKDIDTVTEEFLPLLSDFIKSCVRRAELLVKVYSDENIYKNLDDEFDEKYNDVYDGIKNKDKISKTNQDKLDKIKNTKIDILPTIKKYIEYDEKRINTLVSDHKAYEKAPSPKLLHTMIKNLADNSENEPKVDGQKARNYTYKKLFTKTRDAVKKPVDELLTLYSGEETNETNISETRSAINSFFKLLRIFTENYTNEKMAAGCIDFADCERELYNKLSENGGDNDFRRLLSERFRYIIVDEFQDSNKIQAEIFRLLGEGHLFYVGDVKQSIYAFRGADPYIMADMCREDNEEFETLPLNMNFRSRKAVINTVNAAFNGLMTRKYGGVDYSKEQLTLGCKLPDLEDNEDDEDKKQEIKQLYDTEIYLIGGKQSSFESDDDASDKDMAMPSFVAEKVKELCENESFLVSDGKDKDGNSKPPRRAEYSDFIILLRSNTRVNYYRKAFAKLGIPSVAPKSFGFFEADEVLLAYNYLKIIDDPLLNEEMLKVLMSPVYRFTADEAARLKLGIIGQNIKSNKELKEIADKYRRRSLYSCIINCMKQIEDSGKKKTEDTAVPKLKLFYDHLKMFRSYMNTNSLDNLVRKVYDETDLIAVVSAFEDSTRRVENVRQLQRLASSFEAERGGGLSDFLRFFDRARENSSKGIEEAACPESSAHAVRIMTFHGSKGLEAPICIMTELQTKMRPEDYSGDLLMSFEHFMAIKHTDIKRRCKTKTVPYLAISRFIRERQLGDELRLLYVAMTRAREKLIMVSSVSKDDCKYFDKYIENNTISSDPVLRNAVYESSSPFKCVLSMLLENKDFVNSEANECLIKKAGSDVEEHDEICCRIKALNYSPKEENKEENSEDSKNAVPSEDGNNANDKGNDNTVDEASDIEVNKIISLFKMKYDHEKDTDQQAKFTVTELAHKDSVKPIMLTNPSFISGENGVEKGNAYHHCLQHFPLDRLNSVMSFEDAVKVIERTLDEMTDSHSITADEHDNIEAERVAKFFTSELGQRMLRAYSVSPRNVKREQSFYAEVNGREVGQKYDGRISIQGQVDMYFIENGKIIVVDYKSDTAANLIKEIENYKFQVNIYMKILKKLTGMEVSGMFLYALLTDEAITI